ncbi:type II toxin-antitoxin system Phd/YefM family antitoxin [Candidatus Thiothrix anitrata]|jgi:prevent-host-death family protein|uniref:Type II toxin-antitoxin system prevent-host-death family antitoxin n=1 Tax=Candidatus Thiothrix anitrata TaxID=2823902 RepID=A0ABX7X3U6_9GAMM|nr:type II toxin-antitoxin system prevent-host-death family antitoxin [Candidatus Thiothrix anitrata]QTR50544.1 type II toxin-antitoxin system prevent-host-death family antitoxin [Candidatus Thiothrix anitrata]
MQVSIRELKTHLSHYLQQTRSGEAIDITSHRRIIARLQGIVSSENPGIQALLAQGATWSGRKPTGASLVVSHTEYSMSDLILDMRG